MEKKKEICGQEMVLWNDLSVPPAISEDFRTKLLTDIKQKLKSDVLPHELDVNFPYSSTFTDFYAKVKHTSFTRETCVCLSCYCQSLKENEMTQEMLEGESVIGDKKVKVKFISLGKSSLRSHLVSCHGEVLKEDTAAKAWSECCSVIAAYCLDKKFKGYKRNKSSSTVKRKKETGLLRSEFKKFFQLDRYNKARVKQALWLMQAGLPSTVVEGKHYRDFISTLNPSFDAQSRQTESKEELLIYGLCAKIVKERIKEAALFFEGKAFLSLQTDAWTSKGGCHVLGVSCAFCDPVSKKLVTFMLKAEPMGEGKTAADYSSLLKKVMKEYGIKKSYCIQVIGDDETALQNAFERSFDEDTIQSVCLAHKINTLTRHALNYSSKQYSEKGENYFEKGFKFFAKIRRLINFFKNSNQRTYRLKKLQKDESTQVKLITFSSTRWTGCYTALARLNRVGRAIREYFVKYPISSKLKKSICLSDKEWKSVTQFLVLLKPIYDFTLRVQFRKKPVGSYRYLLLNDLKTSLSELAAGTKLSFTVDKVDIESQCISEQLVKTCLKRFLKELRKEF